MEGHYVLVFLSNRTIDPLRAVHNESLVWVRSRERTSELREILNMAVVTVWASDHNLKSGSVCSRHSQGRIDRMSL